MGIIKAVTTAVGGALADQWLEAVEPDDMGDRTVFVRGVQVRRGKICRCDICITFRIFKPVI